jgi:phosphatidylinositol alpha-1,6-mannosyltransferase
VSRDSLTEVLVLAPDPAGVGGIERVTRSLLTALADLLGPERIGMLPVWGRPSTSSLPCRLLRRGAAVRDEPPGRVGIPEQLSYTSAALQASWRLRHRLVIVACHPSLGPVAWMCRLASGAPYAVWCHGYETWGRLQWSVRVALARADVVFAPSEFTARLTEQAAGLSPGNIRVIPHCVSPDLPLPEAERRGDGSAVVLTVTRLDPRNAYKGLDTLLQAWPQVRRRVGRAELVVAGDGPDRRRLESMVESLGVADAVRFAGRVTEDELARLYGSAAVFALPARTKLGPDPLGEGFGLVFLEAAAAGLPVVAGDAGPAPEVVANGETGILVDPDNEGAVADAIVGLLRAPDMRRRMGEAGRQHVREHYSFETFRTRVAHLMDDLALRRRGSLK